MNQSKLTLLSGLFLATTSYGDTLTKQLETKAASAKDRIPAEIRKDFADGIDAVRKADIVSGAKKIGDKAPDFTLTNALGKRITLSDQLKSGPVVLTWYRGGWCPYCNIALAAYQKSLPEIKKAGATLIALTPELPDKTLDTKEKSSLEFEVLTDLNHRVAKEYGLLFKLTPEVQKHYKAFFDLEKFNGNDAGEDTIPLAAGYVIDQEGVIRWAFVDADYRKRAEPSEIVNFLKTMK